MLSEYSDEKAPSILRCPGLCSLTVLVPRRLDRTYFPFPLTIGADGFSPPFDYEWQGDGWLQFKRGK